MLFWEWAFTLLGVGGREWMRVRVRVRNPIWPKWREWVGFGGFRRRRDLSEMKGSNITIHFLEKDTLNHSLLIETL